MLEEEVGTSQPVETSAGGMSDSEFRSGGLPEGGDSGGGAAALPPSADAGAGQQAQETEQLTIRGLGQSLGYQFPETIADDYTAVAHLVAQAQEARALLQRQRESDIYTQLGRQLAPKAQQLGQFLQQQQAPQAPKSWEPPPFDERWLALVQQDPATGVYVSKPNVPPSIAEAVNKWSEWSTAFHRNPVQTLNPLLEQVKTQAIEAARAEMQQALGQQRQLQAVQQIAAANASWFYSKDANGQLMTDPTTGQYLPTALGSEYLALVRGLSARGVNDPLHRDEIARAILQNRLQANPEVAQRQQVASQTQIRNRNALQALGRGAQPQHALEPSAADQAGLSFADRLKGHFRANGITDDDIVNSFSQG